MSNIKINYHQFHVQEYLKSPFSLDGVGYEPEMAYVKHDNSTYYECPAWKHKQTRTFLIRSPIDVELVLDRKIGNLYSTNLNSDLFNTYCSSTFVPGWFDGERCTIQLSVPRFIFWTNEKNIWIESKPHYLTSVKNNLSSIPAWFNMSNWIRPVGTAFNIIDLDKPVSIKRGDVLYEVCFYSKNLDNGILLQKKSPPNELLNSMDKMVDLKKYLPMLSNKFIFKNKSSKCPFNFL